MIKEVAMTLALIFGLAAVTVFTVLGVRVWRSRRE